ncbi:nitronate monooxygenase [Nesterenkonia populi]
MPSRLIRSRLPIVAAPMAGGPTGPALTEAVADAGALPFLAGGYKTPEALSGEMEAARRLGRPVRSEPVRARGAQP